MKRITIYLLSCLFVLSAFGSAQAALTCVQTNFYTMPQYDALAKKKYEMQLTCTFNATPGTAVAVLDSTMMGNMNGKWAYMLIVNPGTPAPDSASIAISDSRGLALMTAAGNGITMVHATSTLQALFEGPASTGDGYPLVNKDFPWTITITDQATNSAVVDLYIQLVD